MTMNNNTGDVFKHFSSFISSIADHENCFDYLDEEHLLSSDFSILKMFDKTKKTLCYAAK